MEHILPREAVLRGTYEVVVESSCNGMFGVPLRGDIIAPPDVSQGYSSSQMCLIFHHFLDEQVLPARLCGPCCSGSGRMYALFRLHGVMVLTLL